MSKQRVVIVTGGGSGMGKAMALRFAKNGDKVYILGRRLDALKTVAEENSKIEAIQADVTIPKDVQRAISTITKTHETVDILINCAGASGSVEEGLSLDEALKHWNKTIDVNLSGPFLMIYAVRPIIARPGGRIINISSVAALSGSSRAGGVAYSAAKAGLHGLMRTLVKEFAPQGVTVNTIAPGFIVDTGFFGDKAPQDRIDAAVAQIPAKRTGNPDEIANASFYLASEEAGYINGDILNINGGWQFGR